jgi:predicted unusual protein kinase regulating ubiquinone biosynthesis (AarF/ABC1/UbiB family)
MKKLLSDHPSYYIPEVYLDFSSAEVLSSEFVSGMSIDELVNSDAKVLLV